MVNAAEKKEEAKKEGESEFESEEEAKKEGDEEEEEEEDDDQEDEIEIHCAQPAAEDPEKKYTTFATNNGFEVIYKVDEEGVQQPAGLEKSDEDNDREVITFKWSGNQEDGCNFPKPEEQKAKSAQKTRAKSVSGHKRQREEKVAAEEEKAKQAKLEEHAEKIKYAEKLRLTELKVKQAVLLKEKELRAELAEAERQKEAKVCEELRHQLEQQGKERLQLTAESAEPGARPAVGG
ncbi:hypothetical protein CYMTET_46532 [Cymbomonas tetramitiformis]|uniref:Uncharacterized protein n=2 Tax=Cymbomonas tetramitiformis TaxID=36881 RepID=A0AAE0BXW9_9CHLO|nr:hypothetical protein CYMTET_46532 [Cymbomonas tetramitiformis]